MLATDEAESKALSTVPDEVVPGLIEAPDQQTQKRTVSQEEFHSCKKGAMLRCGQFLDVVFGPNIACYYQH